MVLILNHFLPFSLLQFKISVYNLAFSTVFPETALFISLKNSISKLFVAFSLSLVFISIYYFSQAFWLNLITLWTFLKINPWFNPWFKFPMWIAYSHLSWKLVTSFSTIPIFFLSGENGKLLWSSGSFSRYSTSTSR